MNLYEKIILKTDKKKFAFLFNIRSLLLGRSSRLTWDKSCFFVLDKKIPSFKYKIRHQRQCNMAYQYGIIERAKSLANCYFLNQIQFNDNDIFLDCGANVGDLKIWFELQNKKINYVGFEPSPLEFNYLQDNVAPSRVHNIGLWKTNGEMTFYISSQGADSSLIEPKIYDNKIVCKICKLDEFISKPVKCLKLEAEGAEPEILEGLGHKLNMIEYVTADLGYERGIEAESTLVPVTNYLLRKGFELKDISHDRISALYKNLNFNF